MQTWGRRYPLRGPRIRLYRGCSKPLCPPRDSVVLRLLEATAKRALGERQVRVVLGGLILEREVLLVVHP
jgi:hypothetical protein